MTLFISKMWHAKDMFNIKKKSLWKLVAEFSLVQALKFPSLGVSLKLYTVMVFNSILQWSVLDTWNPSIQKAEDQRVMFLLNSSSSGLRGKAQSPKKRGLN